METMKWKCYQVTRDEESGEWWREFKGYVIASTPEEARTKGMAKFGFTYGEPFRVYRVGERVKLRGVMSDRAREALFHERFNKMSREEQEAYLGY